MAEYFKVKMFNPSEEEINFDSFIKFTLFCFKLVFFDFAPLTASSSNREKYQNTAKICFCRMCLFVFVLAIISMCNYSLFIAEDFVTASRNVPTVVNALQFTFTTYILHFRRKDIWNIFEDLRGIFADHDAENAKYKIKQYLNGYHFLIKIYASTFALVFLPVLFPTFNYMITGIMKPTVNFWFPFDPFTPSTFPFALFWANFVTWTFLVFKLSADSLIYALITVIAMEFDILKADFMDIKQIQKIQRIDKLKILIERHNKLLKIADKLQNFCGMIFFVSFVISSLVICYIAFSISTANDFSTFFFYTPYFFMILGQMLLLCVYGQKIWDSSASVGDGVFNCDWEEFQDVAFTKHLILIIVRAQKPKRLTGMGFFDVSLASFTSVSI